MTIQRQYSLPNCTLTLEGIGEDSLTAVTVRPVMSVLVTAECRFVGHDQPIAGGSEFFEHLVQAVNHYAQQVLSGVRSPKDPRRATSLVDITPQEHHYHQLAVKSAIGLNGKTADLGTAVALKLSTVQLFDLVEAIDQALADSQTLPQLSLTLSPLPRRQAQVQEPIGQRVLPALLGVGSVAIAATALFFLPIPEVRRPEDRPPATTPEAIESPPPATSETPPSPVSESPGPEATPAPLSDEAVAALLEDATPLSDPAVIAALTQTLRGQIDDTWERADIDFTEPLIYRVGVNPAGEIVGYRYVNDAALTYVESTPLPSLRAVPGATPSNEPIGQYRVVLTPDGVVQVSPWFAVPTPTASAESAPSETPAPVVTTSPTPAPTAAAVTTALESVPTIRTGALLEDLNRNLYRSVRSNWERRSFPTDLTYRVTLDQSGQVLTYAPVNQAARDYDDAMPLADLQQPEAAATATGQAEFRVVVTEAGILEVSPWNGYPD